MSCLLDIFSGYSMKSFISKHMTYRSRNKGHGRKQTNQSRTLATLMSLKDGTLSKQRQTILNSADDDLSDISIDSIHFDSGVSCNENDSSKPVVDAMPRGLQTESTLRIDQIRPFNVAVSRDSHARRDKKGEHCPSDTKVNNADFHDYSNADRADCDFVNSGTSSAKEILCANITDFGKISCKDGSKLKHQTLPSKAKAKTLSKTSKQKKVPKSYSQSLPRGKQKRKPPSGVKKDLKFQGQAGVFREDYENESNITQIYNNCKEKWTTIINLDRVPQSSPDESVGVIVDSIEPGSLMPSVDDR